MTPLIVVGFLVAFLVGFTLAFGWQRTRVATARAEARIYRSELTTAWIYADTEERVAHELHAQLDVMFDLGYDAGFADAAGIDVGGEVDR